VNARRRGATPPSRRQVRAIARDRPQFLPHRPDERGHFGIYGGRFVAETLMPLILEVERAYARPRPIRRSRRSWTAT
jgi:hypothetical protein